jgi:hypothetical protein
MQSHRKTNGLVGPLVYLNLSQKKMNFHPFLKKSLPGWSVRSLSKNDIRFELILKCFAQLCTLHSYDPVHIMYNQNFKTKCLIM